MEDQERYRDYVAQLISRREELEVQFDAFLLAPSGQKLDTLRCFVKRNAWIQVFEQECGSQAISGLGLNPLYESCAYSDYVLQFIRLQVLYKRDWALSQGRGVEKCCEQVYRIFWLVAYHCSATHF